MFLKSISVTLGYVLGSTIPVWTLSLFAAVVFFEKFPGREFLKMLFFAPVLPSLVVVATIWIVLVNPNGLLTAVLRPFTGLAEIKWLTDPTLSPITMILVHDWAATPFYMLIWLAGLTGIPSDLRDAARVDGANRFQTFLRVELPLLRPTAVFIASISMINAFQAFTLQFTLSPGRGGPVDVNTTMGLLIWKYGFQYYRMGDAAAISVVLCAMIMIVTGAQLAFSRGDRSRSVAGRPWRTDSGTSQRESLRITGSAIVPPGPDVLVPALYRSSFRLHGRVSHNLRLCADSCP